MANELTLGCTMRFVKGNVDVPKNPPLIQRNIAGTDYTMKTQLIGTTREALVIGEIGTAYYLWIRNHDTTNYVEIFPDATNPALVKLLAGDVALFPLATSTPNAQANTAAVEVDYFMVEL